MKTTLFIVLLSMAFSASARMYQWVNTTTGRVELSGTPPAWYRSDLGGPRVQVFDNGQMVDDTAIRLGSAQNEKLRATAFEEFEVRRRAEQIKRLERAARREAARSQAEPMPDSDEAGPDLPEAGPSQEGVADDLPDVLDAGMIDRLKTLIQSFDRQSGETN